MNGLEFHTKVVPKTSIFDHLALLLTFENVQKRPLPEHFNPVCYPILVFLSLCLAKKKKFKLVVDSINANQVMMGPYFPSFWEAQAALLVFSLLVQF